jgi:hypothetical protein
VDLGQFSITAGTGATGAAGTSATGAADSAQQVAALDRIEGTLVVCLGFSWLFVGVSRGRATYDEATAWGHLIKDLEAAA